MASLWYSRLLRSSINSWHLLMRCTSSVHSTTSKCALDRTFLNIFPLIRSLALNRLQTLSKSCGRHSLLWCLGIYGHERLACDCGLLLLVRNLSCWLVLIAIGQPRDDALTGLWLHGHAWFANWLDLSFFSVLRRSSRFLNGSSEIIFL